MQACGSSSRRSCWSCSRVPLRRGHRRQRPRRGRTSSCTGCPNPRSSPTAARTRSVAQALAAKPCRGPVPFEGQGEALGIQPDDLGYFTVAEGPDAALHHLHRPRRLSLCADRRGRPHCVARRGQAAGASFFSGRQKTASRRSAPPPPAIAAIARPVQPVQSRSMASSIDHSPAPIAPIARPTHAEREHVLVALARPEDEEAVLQVVGDERDEHHADDARGRERREEPEDQHRARPRAR